MNSNVRAKVLARDRHACRGCGAARLLELHHIAFRSQGGQDHEDNLISLCQSCHHGRGHGLVELVPAWVWRTMIEADLYGVDRQMASLTQRRCCGMCLHRLDGGFCEVQRFEVEVEGTCGSFEIRPLRKLRPGEAL